METYGGDDDDGFAGNINPADCATLEFPVSPALILSPGGGWLLLVTRMQ